MEAYKRDSHTVWDCEYHPIWVTKYRYAVLGGDVGTRCRESSMSEAWGEEPAKVIANYREEEEELGSFVEFYGWWDWKDGADQPADTSHLVLYNDDLRRNQYTICQDSECTLMSGKYTRMSRGAELVLEGVFGEAKSRIVFRATGGGTVKGSYWRDKSARGSPDGTIELEQL